MKRWLSIAVSSTVAAGIAAACGGGGDDTHGRFKDGGSEGGGFITTDSGRPGACVPKTCADLGAECGPQGDGCGEVIECGDCAAPDFCGGGGPSQCGVPNSNCTPKTCADLDASCGPQGDGCGEVIQCGDCAAPEFCGGGGPSVCGSGVGDAAPPVCVPTKTDCEPDDCGPISDGCGALIQCGTCTAPAICGGGLNGRGRPSKCGGALADGGSPCVPQTCADVGANCGRVANGCGALTASCGRCPAGLTCGGSGVHFKCGSMSDAAPPPCTGLCQQQVTCPGGGTTSVSGVVRAPNGTEPIYNAIVYVPNAPVDPFPAGVSCQQCSAEVSGEPLVKVVTGPDGAFTLGNMPVGNGIPIVIQIGRWRRQITANVAQCTDTPLGRNLTRLPRNQGEGDIPHTAIATGDVDTLECVLRKIGIDDAEFTQPTENGRIHMYVANGADRGNGTPDWSQLWGDINTLRQYDVVLLPCEGFADDAVGPASGTGISAQQRRLIDYTSAGGRVYATHYSYTWLSNTNAPGNGPVPFSRTADFNLDQNHPNDPNTVIGVIDTSFQKGRDFATWLEGVNALRSNNPPKITLNISRHDMDSVIAPATSWITVDPLLPNGNASPYPDAPQHYTFNTPVNAAAAAQCGRVLYSDFHVSNASAENTTFPDECDSSALTAQEKVLEFMLFDLAACIEPDDPPPPGCQPLTCADQNIACGPAGDGCGRTIQCGPCPAGQTCGGGGVRGQCGGPNCTPRTCRQAGADCGDAADGCGGVLHCGDCTNGQVCGVLGVPNECAPPNCTPFTCAEMGVSCGPSGDGCGGLLDCGTCPPGCTPRTCAAAGANCGKIGDDCGGLIDCGVCVPPDTCGGGGVPNLCGSSGPVIR